MKPPPLAIEVVDNLTQPTIMRLELAQAFAQQVTPGGSQSAARNAVNVNPNSISVETTFGHDEMNMGPKDQVLAEGVASVDHTYPDISMFSVVDKDLPKPVTTELCRRMKQQDCRRNGEGVSEFWRPQIAVLTPRVIGMKGIGHAVV